MGLKILLIGNEEEHFLVIKHLLKQIDIKDSKAFWVNDYQDAMEKIISEEYDIILVDIHFHIQRGTQLIEEARAKKVSTPIILLIDTNIESVENSAIASGASDFLVKKELSVNTLNQTFRYALERFERQRYINVQERKYRNLFELSLETFLILNERLEVNEYNTTFFNTFRFDDLSKKIQEGLSFRSLFKFENEYLELIDKLKLEKRVKGFRATLKGQDNQIIALISIAKILRADSFNQDAYQVSISDLTKLLAQEEELKRSEKMLMSERMARMIAHEIRNPLTNIRLAIEELQELSAEESDARMLENMIDRNAARISDLISELLQSARPPELEKTKANLIEIVKRAIDSCQDRIDLLDVKLTIDFCSQEIMGFWDEEKLQMALSNIIINAVESMEKIETPKLFVKVTKEDYLSVVSIQDNGKGMNDKEIKSLFDPFYTNRKNGMGLGMTATLNIIKMHKGKLSVTSEEGKGTILKVALE